MKEHVKFSVKFSFLCFHFSSIHPSIYSSSTLAVSMLPLVAAFKFGFEYRAPNVWRQLSALLLMGKAWVWSIPSPRPKTVFAKSWRVNQQSRQAICTAESFTWSLLCVPFLCAGLLLSYCTHTKVHKRCGVFFFLLQMHSCKTLLAGRKGSPNNYDFFNLFLFLFGPSSCKIFQSSKVWSKLREYAHPSVFTGNLHSWTIFDYY